MNVFKLDTLVIMDTIVGHKELSLYNLQTILN